MCFISNEMHFNEIFDKFNEFYNDINVIKIRIVNEMKSSFNLSPNIILK